MGAINFTNGLGIHDTAMQLRAKRAEVLANNLANSDTPGFKARDFDFKAILAAETHDDTSFDMASTHGAHLSGTNGAADSDLKYRNPLQPSIDGNTVDAQTEQAQFARNSMDYSASFEFLNGKFKGMRNAIRGE
ncbi:flagellar basal body rod protein FlgB [Thalassolituus maritimus]|uniref:Flagellar basal body rod protein FlgB n=1 Tax=Thalassolituus maritimus TaxID=484498 RepID=A0ABQ0A0A6_9GAMM